MNNNFLCDVVEMFDDFLTEKNVAIPNADRDEQCPESGYQIWGSEFSDMMENIREVCRKHGLEIVDSWTDHDEKPEVGKMGVAIAADIVNVLDVYLLEKGILIPNEDRDWGGEPDAYDIAIYSVDFIDLVDAVREIFGNYGIYVKDFFEESMKKRSEENV